MLSYWFYPNPGSANYSDTKVLVLFAVCAGLIVLSFVLSMWRNRLQNSVTKKLSKSWPSALRWFGIVGLALIIARVEDIQFFAVRFLWALWAGLLLLYVVFQMWMFRKKHYTIMKEEKVNDPRKEYLPKGSSL